jgi:serine/threonine protein kinase
MEKLPERIGKYDVLDLIGRGAMGVVYKAKDPVINRMVALKRISLSDVASSERIDEFKARFFVEARAAGGLRHPRIITIYDVDEADGAPFMAMEYLEGGSLSRLMKERGALPLQQAVSIARQVAMGLGYAHERGIIHRDIKPDNILMDMDGRAVITDFGAARLQDSELTRPGEVLGTPHYMSPEQILGDKLDGRSDLFSLGVVFYLMVTGRRPFKGDTVSSICYHIVHSPPEPLPAEVNIPPILAPILERLLSKSKDDRPPSAEELIRELDELDEEMGDAPDAMTETWDVPLVPIGGPESAAAPSERPLEEEETRYASPPAPLPPPPAAEPARSAPWRLTLVLLLAAAGLLVVFAVGGYGAWRFGLFSPKGLPPPANVEESAGTPDHAVSGENEAPPAEGKSPASNTSTTSPIPAKPERPAPKGPSPAFEADVSALERDAKAAVDLTGIHQFDLAFRQLDTFPGRIDALARRAGPADAAALARAKAAAARAQADARERLAVWARPLVDSGTAALAKATAHVNTDEDAIIQAYAATYPAIQWKSKLPQDMASEVDAFVAGCRDELNDDEWAEAQALAHKPPQP